MNVEVILTNEGWSQPKEGLYFWKPPWQTVPLQIEDGSWSSEDLETFHGHWALVDLRQEEATLAVDRQRSRPLLAARASGGWIVTDQIQKLRAKGIYKEDTEASSLFRHFGHTVGSRTLLQGVWDTPAGSVMRLSVAPLISPYTNYEILDPPVTEQNEYSQVLVEAVLVSVRRLLSETSGRQLVVPISAGYDSRLILTALRHLDAKNVVTYSYGVEASPQQNKSREVATRLEYPYIFVPYNMDELRTAWDKEGAEYVREAWGGTSLPHKQDWFAVRELTRRGVVEPGAIVLPGHTIPAAGARPELFSAPTTQEAVAAEVAISTGGQQGSPREVAANPLFLAVLAENAAQIRFGQKPEENVSLWQWTTLKDRQAKFITNSVRVYEHFGLSWALPLHEREVWEARRSGALELTANREGYKRFVQEFYETTVGKQADETPKEVASSPRPKPAWVSAIGRSVFVVGPRDFIRRWKAYLNPPKSSFGVEAYRPEVSKLESIRRARRGIRGNGVAADLFLQDLRSGSFGFLGPSNGSLQGKSGEIG